MSIAIQDVQIGAIFFMPVVVYDIKQSDRKVLRSKVVDVSEVLKIDIDLGTVTHQLASGPQLTMDIGRYAFRACKTAEETSQHFEDIIQANGIERE